MNHSTPTHTGRTQAVWVALAVGTFLVYLVFGVYYATRSEHLSSRPSLEQRDEKYLRSFVSWDTPYESDAAVYNREAIEILKTGMPRERNGNFCPYAVVYAYFVAACYGIGGVRLLSVAVPQAVLAGLSSLLIGLAVRRIAPQLQPRTGIIAAGLVLINLRLAMYTAYISPTILLMFWVCLALYVMSGELSPTRSWILLTVFGLAMHTQSAFFIPSLGIALWFGVTALRDKLLRRLVAAGAIVLLAGTSILATRTVAGALPRDDVKSTMGVLWEANNPYYESMHCTSLWERRPGNPWTKWSVTIAEQQRYDQYLQRAESQRMDPGLLWIKENPAQYTKLCLIRLRTTLGPFTGMMSPQNRAISTFYWLLIFPAGWYGWWRTRRLDVSRLALCVFLALTAFESLVITEWYLRYRLPVDLMLTMYAGVGYALLLGGRQTDPES